MWLRDGGGARGGRCHGPFEFARVHSAQNLRPSTTTRFFLYFFFLVFTFFFFFSLFFLSLFFPFLFFLFLRCSLSSLVVAHCHAMVSKQICHRVRSKATQFASNMFFHTVFEFRPNTLILTQKAEHRCTCNSRDGHHCLALQLPSQRTLAVTGCFWTAGVKDYKPRSKRKLPSNCVDRNLGQESREQNSVDKELLEIVGSGKSNGQCVKGDNCSFRHDMNKRGKSYHHQIRLRILSCSRMSENHREPEVPVVEWPCKDYLKGTCNNSFCERWHPPECLFYKTKSGCRFREKCSFAYRQVDEQPTKNV